MRGANGSEVDVRGDGTSIKGWEGKYCIHESRKGRYKRGFRVPVKSMVVPSAVASPMWVSMAEKYWLSGGELILAELAEVPVQAVFNKLFNFGSSKQGKTQ